MYSQDRSTYFLQENRQIDCGKYICSQTHECGNWDCGRAIPFLGIFVSNFQFWFFAVWLFRVQNQAARQFHLGFRPLSSLKRFCMVSGFQKKNCIPHKTKPEGQSPKLHICKSKRTQYGKQQKYWSTCLLSNVKKKLKIEPDINMKMFEKLKMRQEQLSRRYRVCCKSSLQKILLD